MEGNHEFLQGAEPALGCAFGDRPDGRAFVVLFIDDSDDDELVAAIATTASTTPFGHDFRGNWGHMSSLDHGDHLRFTLTRDSTDYERAWLLSGRDFVDELLPRLERNHFVILMPDEIAVPRDKPDEFDFAGLAPRMRASLMVRITYAQSG